MLRSLHIKNYLLIPEVQIDFDGGLTVITGETGAGKSLIVDSLKLALGERTDASIIRVGCDTAQITVTFDIQGTQADEFLKSSLLESDQECVVHREVYRNKPTRAYVNGRPASLQVLRELGACLLEIHGQHEHHSLLKASTQRTIFDGYAGISEQSRQLARCARLIHSREAERKDAEQKRLDYEQHLEYLRDQRDALEQLQPGDNEFTELKEELVKLSHSEELSSTLEAVSMGLYYDDHTTVSGTLSGLVERLRRLGDIDSSLNPHCEALEEAMFRIDDVARELQSMADRIDGDPSRIESIEERMAALQRQARIHNSNADKLPEVLDTLASKIDSYEAELEKILQLDTNLEEVRQEYQQIASGISKKRKETYAQFGQVLTDQMQNLGMEGGVFGVELLETDPDQFASYGNEDLKFKVSTNPGQEKGALSDVASGGELSRLSLALHVTSMDVARVPSIVFDEVDVGIGGRVAERVGKLLRTLGKSVQIICITHLPQVAAQGHQQLNVSKITADLATIEINSLDNDQRVNEIARMLGGAKITDRTLEHAREMLSQGFT